MSCKCIFREIRKAPFPFIIDFICVMARGFQCAWMFICKADKIETKTCVKAFCLLLWPVSEFPLKSFESHLMHQPLANYFILFFKLLKCSDSSLEPLVAVIGITLQSQHCKILSLPLSMSFQWQPRIITLFSLSSFSIHCFRCIYQLCYHSKVKLHPWSLWMTARFKSWDRI